MVSALGASALAASLLMAVPGTAVADDAPPSLNDCLQIDGERVFEPYGEISIVDCATVHNAEVFALADYPDDLGAPSTLGQQVWQLFGATCNYTGYKKWLGAGKVKLPILGNSIPRLPTDEQWEAGARWVVCSAMRLGPQGTLTNTGTLPALFASTPFTDWLFCLHATPKSGQWNSYEVCNAKAKWLVIPGGEVKGAITQNYPKDLQAKANAMCDKYARPFLKKGAKSKAVAGLGPKSDYPDGNPFADCFISMADWNRKAG